MTGEPAREHYHWERVRCTGASGIRRWPSCADTPDMLIGLGPVSGLLNVAAELMRHFGIDPSQHPAVLQEVDLALGEESLELGRRILEEHGLIGERGRR